MPVLYSMYCVEACSLFSTMLPYSCHLLQCLGGQTPNSPFHLLLPLVCFHPDIPLFSPCHLLLSFFHCPVFNSPFSAKNPFSLSAGLSPPELTVRREQVF